MKDIVSANIEEKLGIKGDIYSNSPDLWYEFKLQYRFYRKKFRAFFKTRIKKRFINILYITTDIPPKEYIIALQKQYPNKKVSVLVPLIEHEKNEKEYLKFEYFLQNKINNACVYKYDPDEDNIQIFGVYTDGFSDIDEIHKIFDLKYISHYAKCARIFAKKFKPDLIHSENVPFYIGIEFNDLEKYTFSKKVLQTYHDLEMYNKYEPFWSALNLLNKRGLNRLKNDKIIKKNIAALFGIKTIRNFGKYKDCINYLYKNFEQYRELYNISSNTNENILIKRLNDQVLKIFPQIFNDDTFYNPMLYSIKRASAWGLNSVSKDLPSWTKDIKKTCYYLKRGITNNVNEKIEYRIDITNFREQKPLNKNYLLKQFDKLQIEHNFTDKNLFVGNDYNIIGYLDNFYRGTLLFIPFNQNSKEKDLKKAVLAILKAFELRKNIQVIFNYPKNMKSQYMEMFLIFLKTQSSIEGKWIVIEGEINYSQFLASSDMVIIPSDENYNVENILYNAIKFGCIPVVTDKGFCDDTVKEIFDDMNVGFGFKKPDPSLGNLGVTKNKQLILSKDTLDDNDEFASTLIRAINFHIQNYTIWNSLIKNGMNFDSSWNFDIIKNYNDIYEEL